jgi:hypothetical protein
VAWRGSSMALDVLVLLVVYENRYIIKLDGG